MKSPVVISGSGVGVADVLPVGHAQLRVVDALALRLALLDGLAEVRRASCRRSSRRRCRPRRGRPRRSGRGWRWRPRRAGRTGGCGARRRRGCGCRPALSNSGMSVCHSPHTLTPKAWWMWSPSCGHAAEVVVEAVVAGVDDERRRRARRSARGRPGTGGCGAVRTDTPTAGAGRAGDLLRRGCLTHRVAHPTRAAARRPIRARPASGRPPGARR